MLSVGIRQASAGNDRCGGLRQFAVRGVLHNPCLRGLEGFEAPRLRVHGQGDRAGRQACDALEKMIILASGFARDAIVDSSHDRRKKIL